MDTDTDISPTHPAVTPRKLWFGFATSAFAWTALGALDVIVTWRTCDSFGHGTGAAGHGDARILSFCLALSIMALTVGAGVTSYRNWRTLSRTNHFIDAEATDRREFMALLGVFVSFTLGMGVLWLALGPIFIVACQRAK